MTENQVVSATGEVLDEPVPGDGDPQLPEREIDTAEPRTEEPQTAAAAEPDWNVRMAGAERRLDEALALAKRRDELVDRLHNENQSLRGGELQTAMLPLLRDLMRLIDDLAQILESDPQARDVDFVRGALEDILRRYGVAGFAPAPHDRFDSALHAAVGVEPTADPEGDRTVAAVRRRGYRRDDGTIVRAADVTVRRYRPAAVSDAEATGRTTQEPASEGGEPDINQERN